MPKTNEIQNNSMNFDKLDAWCIYWNILWFAKTWSSSWVTSGVVCDVTFYDSLPFGWLLHVRIILLFFGVTTGQQFILLTHSSLLHTGLCIWYIILCFIVSLIILFSPAHKLRVLVPEMQGQLGTVSNKDPFVPW